MTILASGELTWQHGPSQFWLIFSMPSSLCGSNRYPVLFLATSSTQKRLWRWTTISVLLVSGVRSVEKSSKTGLNWNKRWSGWNRRVLRLLLISGRVRLKLRAVVFGLCHGHALHGSYPNKHSLDMPGWWLARYPGIGTGWGHCLGFQGIFLVKVG